MPVEYASSPQLVAPAGAVLVTFTYSGVAWTWSAWVEVLAAAPAGGALLTGVIGRLTSTNRHAEYQVGVGDAGAEAAIATLKGSFASYAGDHVNVLPIPIDAIAAGVRVAMRSRIHASGGTIGGVIYAAKPLAGVRTVTFRATDVSSPGAIPPYTVSAADWANSAWVQLIASASADLALAGIGIIATGISDTGEFTLEIGVGGAGAESPILSMPLNGTSANYTGRLLFHLPNPLVGAISMGDRVAGRVRGQLDAGDSNIAIWLTSYELPL